MKCKDCGHEKSTPSEPCYCDEHGLSNSRLIDGLNAMRPQVARLRTAIEKGQYGTRSLVGDVVLDMETILKDYAE